MTAPLISIVVPSYNHAQYIGACLDSIYFQDYENLEIIIVDDCSPDDSATVIEAWLDGVENDTASYLSRYDEETDEFVRTTHKRYDRQRSVTFLRNERNLGSTRTYNRGFRRARGEYCSFVVSDDICHPQMLSTLARPLDEDRADFVYSDMFVIDDDHRILKEFRLPDYDFEKAFCDWYLCGVATLYRRTLHLEHGYYDEDAMADDHECYLRFAMNGARFLHIPKVLYSVRSHDNRQEGLHSSSRFSALLDHSKALTLKARRWRDENEG
jgi:glycosyltransferase involved in cell wall biosynthesis